MSNLIEKAQQVSDMVNDLHERVDGTVFKGESWDGDVKISLKGTGEPVSVSVELPIPANVRALLERGIEEALERCCEARTAFLNDGLAAIQEVAGVGPDFEPPF